MLWSVRWGKKIEKYFNFEKRRTKFQFLMKGKMGGFQTFTIISFSVIMMFAPQIFNVKGFQLYPSVLNDQSLI